MPVPLSTKVNRVDLDAPYEEFLYNSSYEQDNINPASAASSARVDEAAVMLPATIHEHSRICRCSSAI